MVKIKHFTPSLGKTYLLIEDGLRWRGASHGRTGLEPLAEALSQNLLSTLAHLRKDHLSFQAMGLVISENLLAS